MERPLLLGERIMVANGDQPLNCVFPVKLRGQINPKRVERALIIVQNKYPLLRATIDIRSKVPQFTFHDHVPQIPLRIVDRTSDTQWVEESKREWKKMFPFDSGPLIRFVWTKSDAVSELILVCPHVICDGTTLVTLIRELLTLIDNPTCNIGDSKPFLSLQEILSETDLDRGKTKALLLSSLAHIIFPILTRLGKRNKGRDYVILWNLSVEDTSTFIRQCKTEKVSVHSALCCAFIQAFMRVKGRKARGKVISPADIRRFVPAIKKDTMFAFAPVVDLSLKGSTTSDFWDLCRYLHSDMIDKLNKLDLNEMLAFGERFHSVAVKLVKFVKSNPGSHDVTISNMGRLDVPEQYKTFDLETIWNPLVAFPWRNPNTLFVSTYKGTMSFSFISNDDFVDEADAQNIKCSAMEIIREKALQEAATAI